MWIVKPRQLKTGGWRLICDSDEGGGFREACEDHDHPTMEEAANCERGKAKADEITGIKTSSSIAAFMHSVSNEDLVRIRKAFAECCDMAEGFWISYRRANAHTTTCGCQGCSEGRERIKSYRDIISSILVREYEDETGDKKEGERS